MASTQEVDVEMEHRLSRAWAYIHDGPVSLFHIALAGDLGCREVTAANHFGILGLRFFQSSKMLSGDDQHMRRRLRIDVFKGKHVLVLVDFLGRNLAAQNAAEEAVGRGFGHRSVTMAETITHESTTETRRKEELEN